MLDRDANYIQGGLFRAPAVRDVRLITGQQQYSGRTVAHLVIAALGARTQTLIRSRRRGRTGSGGRLSATVRRIALARDTVVGVRAA